MSTSLELQQHVQECSKQSQETRAALVDFAKALAATTAERRDQFDKINTNIIRMLLSIIGAVLFEIAKTKGLL